VFSMMDSLLIEGVRLWADRRVAQTYFFAAGMRTLVTSANVPVADAHSAYLKA
jgi:hypothetical protein